ncbi:hypothetical protein IEQ34_009515 [Dendrobium chrysotoxum]|uniref:Uncharacterized protein n=1 Tax=Dendrobium chrysotoxum TaxID=161865 RepID=A0AAV7GJB4_DENCH|nr:hypothetical protein IEQ34_009515 [Dendrobium chrysotoxum]
MRLLGEPEGEGPDLTSPNINGMHQDGKDDVDVGSFETGSSFFNRFDAEAGVVGVATEEFERVVQVDGGGGRV